MLRHLILFLLTTVSKFHSTAGGIRHFSTFVVHQNQNNFHPKLLRRTTRHSIAFVDSYNKESMASLKSNSDDISDAEAYQESVSAAVDFTSVYARNGVVTATRSVRDIDTNSRRQFIYNIPLPTKQNESKNPPFISPPIEIPTKVKARIPSPTGSKIAILVEENVPSANGESESKRNVFEIWTNSGHSLAKRIVLPSDKHGPVCTDFAWFGGISWSPDESALVYTAEVNKPKTVSHFTTSPSSSIKEADENAIRGGQYTLGVGKSEDWGEKYGSTALLTLFCINVDTGKIGAVQNVPQKEEEDSPTTHGGYVLGQPKFSPCGKSLIYTGWDAGEEGEMPRRLGAIYCFHRPCKIYASPVSGLLNTLATAGEERTSKDDASYTCLTPNDRLARSPRFSKPNTDGISKLAYLCNTKGFDTHGGCMALHLRDWNLEDGGVVKDSLEVVVDVVQLPGERECDESEVSGIKFPGLFLHQLRDDCFSPDGKYIVTTTEWGCVNKIVAISLDDGTVSPINFDLLKRNVSDDSKAQQFLAFTEDGGAIVSQSEANRPTVLGYLHPTFHIDAHVAASNQLIADLPPISSTSFSSLKHDNYKTSNGYSYRIMTVQPEHGDVKVPVGLILLVPDDVGEEKLPLIVVPHGGPHTCMSTSYLPSYSYLCKNGYAVLHVNFRGSTGFGQAALESLAGNAGSVDVLDVVAAARLVIDAGIADPNRVGICGGSHGGFLAGHCIGQHPDLFKVAAMRNPCTNIASMATSTDIPDWCYVETLGSGHYDFSHYRPPTKEELNVMWDKSPIAHMEHVKAPTLMGLGMKDKRVPPSQGIEYYHALRAKNVPTKLLVYDECDHAIDLVSNEADFWINTKLWFDQYL